jgi:hypothetical protein
VAHGVNPAVKEVETSDAAAIRDSVAVQFGGEQLRDRDHPMLRGCQSGDQNVGCAEFVGTIAMNSTHPAHNRASPRRKGAATLSSHLNAHFVTYRGYGFAAMKKIAITISASVT